MYIFCFLSMIFSITLIILYCGCCCCTCCTFNILYNYKYKNESNIYYFQSSDKNCEITSRSQSCTSEDNTPLANMIQNNFDKTMKKFYNKDKENKKDKIFSKDKENNRDKENNKDKEIKKDKKENNRQIETSDKIYLKNSTGSQSYISEDNKPLANMNQNNFDKTMKINYNKDKKNNKDNKNKKDNKNYKDKKENNRQIETVDIIYLIDSTGSMGEETKNASKIVITNSEHFKQTYPKIDFQFGIIYYNDPIDVGGEYNDFFQLTKDLEQLKNFCDNWENQEGGDGAEDWVGGYKLALDKIKWRNGRKIIYHICDSPAHGRKYSKEFDDNHQEEKYEKELDTLMERCAKEGIEIVGYYSDYPAKESFEECKKIYDSKNGKSFQIEKYNKSNIVLSKTS